MNCTFSVHLALPVCFFPGSKREEKQKRVAEAKAAREREEQDKKQRQLEERRQVLHASEQARKKREHGRSRLVKVSRTPHVHVCGHSQSRHGLETRRTSKRL